MEIASVEGDARGGAARLDARAVEADPLRRRASAGRRSRKWPIIAPKGLGGRPVRVLRPPAAAGGVGARPRTGDQAHLRLGEFIGAKSADRDVSHRPLPVDHGVIPGWALAHRRAALEGTLLSFLVVHGLSFPLPDVSPRISLRIRRHLPGENVMGRLEPPPLVGSGLGLGRTQSSRQASICCRRILECNRLGGPHEGRVLMAEIDEEMEAAARWARTKDRTDDGPRVSQFLSHAHDMNRRARSAASIAGDLAFTILSPSKSRHRK